MISILYEDNHLLAAEKPAGLATQPPPRTHENVKEKGAPESSLEEELKTLIKTRDKKPGNVFLHALHRIDKPASGIVLFAKSQKALSRGAEMIRNKACKKTYLALVEGHVHPSEAILEHMLVHLDHRAAVDPTHKEAKKARLRYKVLKSYDNKTVLEIELETGRYHQIRCQLAHIGHPIVGDEKYGSTCPLKTGIALHHYKMALEHPTKKELLSLETALPEWAVIS